MRKKSLTESVIFCGFSAIIAYSPQFFEFIYIPFPTQSDVLPRFADHCDFPHFSAIFHDSPARH